MNLIKDAKNHFQHDWKHRRLLFYLEMLGTLSALVGAGMMSILQENTPFLFVYLVFFLSSSAGILSGNIRQSGWMVLTASVFTIINIIGVFSAFT